MTRYVVKNKQGLYYRKCRDHGPVHKPDNQKAWTADINEARIFEGISACKNSILGEDHRSQEWLDYEKVPYLARDLLGLERPAGPRLTRVMQEGMSIVKIALNEVVE